MKTLYKYSAFLFGVLAMFCACADDAPLQEIQPENQNKSDFVTLNLSYESQNDKEIVVSRSGATAAEKKLYDLHFYVFDKAGNLTGYEEVLPMGDNDVIEEAPATETVSIRAKSGESYIYAVANINESTTYYLEQEDLDLLSIDKGTTDEEYQRNIEESDLTRDAFLSINFKRQYGNENQMFSPDPSGNVFVMSGYVNNGYTVNIPSGTNGAVTLPEDDGHIVKLYRILAKNTFTVTSGTSEGKFTPKSFRLCNVPTSGVLIPNAGIGSTDTYLKDNETKSVVESSYRWNFNGVEEISFYFPENLQPAKNNSIVQWKDREKNSWNGAAKTFTNADNDAAYIEINGDFVDKTGKITANVNYTIHFGDFSPSGELTDFNVIRNYAYKYKVTVDGVDDIKVEAQTTTGEDNPYAEGLIIDATAGKHYDVDAHYEARIMSFKKSTIVDLKNNGSGYILNIKTPFGETKQTVNVKADGVYDMSGELLCTLDNVSSLFNKEADYDWIKFVKNTTGNSIGSSTDISKYTCKYPGDDSEDCLNVFELLAELYNESTYTENNKTEVYYTCFVDENYYAGKSWPEYVDKEPRNMLIANDLDVSADKKSLYAKVAYSISQRSISTFYRTDYMIGNRLVKAFGTEIIDVEDVYGGRFDNDDYGGFATLSDEWEVRSNAVETYGGWSWYDSDETRTGSGWNSQILEHKMNRKEGIQPLYTTVAKACLSRNRDLNGNGKIDSNEVRWYLPGVEQYRALFIGQDALSQQDAYLINRAELEDIDNEYDGNWGNDQYGHNYRKKYHYFTSSSGDKSTFWPEEGLTNNPLSDSYSWAELVRCVRTLESGAEGLTDPERYYTYENNTFDLGGIIATRNYTEAPLEGHNEIEALNNLYSSFVVASNDLEVSEGNRDTNHSLFSLSNITGLDPDDLTQAQDDIPDLCTNYDEGGYAWRTPNQKELGLMVSILPDAQYGTRTRFSGCDKGYWNWHETPGFWSDSGGGGRINVGTGHESGVRIRCVRDKK